MCAERLAQEREALREYRANGVKVAGYTCHSFPASVAAGLGLWTVRVLCGTSSDSESAGEKVVRADVCPLVKSMLGNVADRKGLHSEVDLWIGLYTCDQMRRGLDCLSGQLSQEVHPIQLPATRTPESAAYFAGQVKRLVADIETRHELLFQEGLAQWWEQEYAEAGKVLAKAARSGRVAPLDLHAMFHLLLTGRPFGLASFFGELLAGAPEFKPKKKILLTGGPLSLEDTIVLEELQERGCAVIPLNCTGLNAVEHEGAIPVHEDPVEALALEAFHRPPCSRARPNTPVYERIGKTLTETGADGLIVKCLKFCDQWYTERERLRQAFVLPVLVFDSDYAEGGRQRLMSRIDAFVEML